MAARPAAASGAEGGRLPPPGRPGSRPRRGWLLQAEGQGSCHRDGPAQQEDVPGSRQGPDPRHRTARLSGRKCSLPQPEAPAPAAGTGPHGGARPGARPAVARARAGDAVGSRTPNRAMKPGAPGSGPLHPPAPTPAAGHRTRAPATGHAAEAVRRRGRGHEAGTARGSGRAVEAARRGGAAQSGRAWRARPQQGARPTGPAVEGASPQPLRGDGKGAGRGSSRCGWSRTVCAADGCGGMERAAGTDAAGIVRGCAGRSAAAGCWAAARRAP